MKVPILGLLGGCVVYSTDGNVCKLCEKQADCL